MEASPTHELHDDGDDWKLDWAVREERDDQEDDQGRNRRVRSIWEGKREREKGQDHQESGRIRAPSDVAVVGIVASASAWRGGGKGSE